MEQQKHTFNPLPPGARIISEQDGERIAEWNGITLVDTSMEKQAQQPVPTVEEAMRARRNAKPIQKVRSTCESGNKLDSPSQPKRDPTRLIPGTNRKKNSEPL